MIYVGRSSYFDRRHYYQDLENTHYDADSQTCTKFTYKTYCLVFVSLKQETAPPLILS